MQSTWSWSSMVIENPPQCGSGHKERIQPPVPESYLNVRYVSRPAAELHQGSREPVTLGEEIQEIL
ncbi:hypothetical protein EYF80_030924 [Liparis tanakae]|uniref:Uncharacterized protein n=1 Tax=Liparis tanakae TaxID=230148 RepID=A0A4Z2GZU4_9TELE|nr:hypothetical protein EYF80_030924 [Liparis tanakae]